MRFRDCEERERYMESLERQMEHQREQIQSTLDGIEDSGRRRRLLGKLWNSLPSLPGRTTSVRDAGERETATEWPERAEPRSSTGDHQEGTHRPWWRRIFTD